MGEALTAGGIAEVGRRVKRAGCASNREIPSDIVGQNMVPTPFIVVHLEIPLDDLRSSLKHE
jgi:hypothetical protein